LTYKTYSNTNYQDISLGMTFFNRHSSTFWWSIGACIIATTCSITIGIIIIYQIYRSSVENFCEHFSFNQYISSTE